MQKLNVLIAVGLFGVFSNVGRSYARDLKQVNGEGPISQAERRGIPPDEYLERLGTRGRIQKKQSVWDWLRSSLSDEDERDGGRDQNFTSGVISTTVGTSDDAIRSVIIMTDGKIISAGRKNLSGTNDDFLVTRYHVDGEFDTSFNTFGKVVASFGGGNDLAHAVTYDAQGRVIAGGRTDGGAANAYDFAIVRLETNGALDTTFNSTGKVVTGIGAGADFIRGLKVQNVDGRIVAAGYAKIGSYYNFAVARYFTNGSLDTSFNTTGTLTIANGSNDNGANSVDIDTTGRIVLGGASYNGSDWDFAVVRVNTNGTIDTSFKTTGKITTAILASEDIGFALVADPNSGKIAMGGTTYTGSKYAFATARWESDGALDTSFNTTGKIRHTFGFSDERIFGIRIETNGALLVAGFAGGNGTGNDFAIGRFRSNGTIDTSFNTTGTVKQEIGTAEDTAQDVHMVLDGIILVAGRSYNGSNLDLAVARYNTDGSPAYSAFLDQSLGTQGRKSVNLGSGSDIIYEMVQQTDGRLIASGNLSISANTTGFGVARFNVNGTLDTSFNTFGYLTRTFGNSGTGHVAYGVVVQTDGRLVAAGTHKAGGGGTDMIGVMRYHTNGVLDTSFNTTGIYQLQFVSNEHSRALSIVMQPDGLFVIGGSAYSTIEPSMDLAMLRLNTNGVLDTSFNTTGKKKHSLLANDEEIFGLALQTDGGIVGVGYAFDTTGGMGYRSNLIVRYKSDGRLDTTFNSTGFNLPIPNTASDQTFYGIAVGPNNTTFAVGAYNSSQYVISRIKSNGRLDTSFSNDGIHESGDISINTTGSLLLTRVAVTGNSKIVVAGLAGSPEQFLVVRYTTGGLLDTTFTTQGGATNSFVGSNASTRANALVIQKDGRILLGGQVNNANTDFAIMRYWP